MDVIMMFGSIVVSVVALFLWVAYIVAPVIWVMQKTVNPIPVVAMLLFTISSGLTGLIQLIQWVKLS